jgi:reverse gyrase
MKLNAMRRYVADWSKNSVLIPFKKEDGTLQYVDFSHLNAYDTLTRPIQTVLNRVEQGRADEDGIMDDFVLGLVESTKELLSPFM